MPKTHHYREVGFDYLDSAPTTVTLRQRIPASAAATFASLEDADAWPVWLTPVNKVEWTSPRPFGVGTTRDITGSSGTTSETFFAWEDGRRMSFHFSSGAIPGLDAFAEDYLLEPVGDAECDLVWRYAFGFNGVFKIIRPAFAFGFKRAATQSIANLADYMTEHRAKYE